MFFIKMKIGLHKKFDTIVPTKIGMIYRRPQKKSRNEMLLGFCVTTILNFSNDDDSFDGQAHL